MKKIVNILAIVIFTAVLCRNIFGDELDGRLSEFDFGGINSAFEENTDISVDFKSLVKSAVLNDGDEILSFIKRITLGGLQRELQDSKESFIILIAAAILSGFYKNIITAFHSKESAEVGFAVTYMITVGIGSGIFLPLIGLVEDFCGKLTDIAAGSLPLMLTIITAGGKPSSALAYNVVAAGSIIAVNKAVTYFIVPVFKLSLIMCIVNQLSEEPMLEKLSGLFKSLTEYGLKGAAYIFTFVAGLYRLGSGLGSELVKKGAKSAVGMVPVAGDIINGSVDIGLGIFGAVRSGAGIAFIIIIAAYVFAPVLKIIITAYAFKFLAGLTEPVCDKRITGFLDKLGEYSLMAAGVLFTAAYIFMFGALVFVAIGAGG